MQAGIAPSGEVMWDNDVMRFEELLERFGVEMGDKYPKNAGNGAMYQFVLTCLIAHFPMLYPDTTTGFPADSSTAGASLGGILRDLMASKDSMPVLEQGVAQFCFYCEMSDDHDADNCPTKESLVCIYCSNTVFPKNQKYRQRAKGHSGARCILRYRHHVRKFPAWLEKLELEKEETRKLSHGMAIKAFAAIGEVVYGVMMRPEPVN